MGNHEKALFHAKQALSILMDMIIDTEAISTKTTLGIAYHNVATEYEFLGRHGVATKLYDRGYMHCLGELGEEHNLTMSMFNCM
jgi:hypothetical protein